MKKVIVGLVVILIGIQVKAQEQQGLRLGRYPGIYQLALNPAAVPNRTEISLVSLGAFLDNNMAGVKNTSLLDLARRGPDAPWHWPGRNDSTGIEPPAGVPQDTLYGVYLPTRNNRNYAYGQVRVEGPGAIIALGDQHSVGLAFRWRAMGSSFDVADDMTPIRHYQQPFFSEYTSAPFDFAFLNWTEVALHYAYRRATANGQFNIGVAVKPIFAYTGGYVNSQSPITLSQRPNDQILINGLQGDLGFAVWQRQTNGKSQASVNGTGIGLDIGFQLSGPEQNWQLGLAILDLGSIRLNKNTSYYEINQTNAAFLTGADYDQAVERTNPELAVRVLSEQLFGDPDTTLRGNSFTMKLPTTLSFTGTVAVGGPFHLNALVQYPLGSAPQQIQRPALASIVPAWENGLFALRLPVSYVAWQDLNVGLAMRIGPLTLGSDNVRSLFFKHTFTGTDFYAALHIPLGTGGQRVASSSGKKDKNYYRCYKF